MKAHTISLIAACAALSGCAAMQTAPDQSVMAQKAVYVVGDDAAPLMAQKADDSSGPSKLMRIYWFLGGR